MIRTVVLLCLALALAACSGLGMGSKGPPSPVETRLAATARFAQLLQAGRPAIQVAIEEEETDTVALREVSRGGVDTFVTTDGVALSLRGGFLVGTAGLGGDMTGSSITESIALVTSRRSGTAQRFHTFLNGENQAVTRAYVCVVASRGGRSVSLGTRAGQLVEVDTVLIEERCKSLDQEFTNLYWLRQGTGGILQSRQWAGEFTGPLVTRVVLD